MLTTGLFFLFFHNSLRFQCQSTSFVSVCNSLAQVYYQAVRTFGGSSLAGDDVDAEAYEAYVAAVEAYNAEVEKAGQPEAKIQA